MMKAGTAIGDERPAEPLPQEASVSLVGGAYAALKAAILESTLAPGETVSTSELAMRLGMSRTPIHEAALRLQEEGLAQILPKRGIRIATISPADIREIFEVIVAIEGDAARLAAMLPGDARAALADALDRTTDRMEAALAQGDIGARGLADADFHDALVEGCGNRRFMRIFRTVSDQSHRVRVLTARLRPALETSIPEHRAITRAIRTGAAEAAYAAARAHRLRAFTEILPIVESMGLRHL